MQIQQLPTHERPRERLVKLGTESLNAHELLAILLGSGTKETPVLALSHNILAHFGTLQNLAQATIEELMQIDGVGEAKAVQMKAAFALGMRAYTTVPQPKAKLNTPEMAYQLVRGQMEKEQRELLVVILQDIKSQLICSQVVSIGTLNRTVAHPREVFYPAIRHKAASMIIAHNHPSGDPTPSKEDYAATDTLVEVGRMMQIPIIDHLVIGSKGYVSLRERGYQF